MLTNYESEEREHGLSFTLSITFVNLPARLRLVVQRKCKRRRWHFVFVRSRDDSGADGEELDDVRTPAVTLLLHTHTDHALRANAHRLGLHSLHRQFARIVERLGKVRHLHVLPDLLEPLAQALVCNVIYTASHHH